MRASVAILAQAIFLAQARSMNCATSASMLRSRDDQHEQHEQLDEQHDLHDQHEHLEHEQLDGQHAHECDGDKQRGEHAQCDAHHDDQQGEHAHCDGLRGDQRQHDGEGAQHDDHQHGEHHEDQQQRGGEHTHHDQQQHGGEHDADQQQHSDEHAKCDDHCYQQQHSGEHAQCDVQLTDVRASDAWFKETMRRVAASKYAQRSVWSRFPWNSVTRWPEPEYTARACLLIEKGIVAKARFSSPNSGDLACIYLTLLPPTPPLLTPRGEQLATASGWSYHLSLSRFSCMTPEDVAAWRGLADEFDQIEFTLNISAVLWSATAWLDYSSQGSVLLNDLRVWQLFWGGPFHKSPSRKHLHVSL